MEGSVGNMILKLSVNSTEWHVGLDKASVSLDKANAAVKHHAEHVSRSFKQSSKSLLIFTEAFGEIGRIVPGQLARVGEAVAGVTRQTASMGAGFAKFAGIAAGAAAAAVGAAASLFEMSRKGAEAAERLNLMSQKTGIAIRDLQAFELLGKMTGASLEDVATAMRKFDAGIVGIGRHTEGTSTILRALNVTSSDNKTALLQTAAAFSKMENGAIKNAIAAQLFGKSYQAILPLLNKGKVGFEEAREAAERFGAQITPKLLEQVEENKKSTAELSMAWDKFTTGLASKTLPTITKITEAMASMMSGEVKPGSAVDQVIKKYGDKRPGAAQPKPDTAAAEASKKTDQEDVLAKRKAAVASILADSRAELRLKELEQQLAAAVVAAEVVGTAEAIKKVGALKSQVDLQKQLVELNKQTAPRGFTERELNQMLMPGQARGSAARGRFAEADMRKFDIAESAAVPNVIPEMPNVAAALSGYGVPKPQEAPEPPVPNELTRYSVPLQREDNKAYFDDIREKMKAQGLDFLGVNAAEQEAQRGLTREWDQWALESGNAGQKAKAMFQELSLEGDNFAKTFWAASHAAIEGLEKHLATFIVTGRRRDAIKIGVAFEETILTGLLHSAIGKAAGGLVKLIPSLGKIPGVGDLAKGTLGTRGNPMIVQNVDGAAAAAKSTVPDLAGIPLPGPARVGVGLPDLGGVTKAIAGAGGPGTKGGLGGLFGSLAGIFKSLFGTGKAGGAPTAGAVSDAKGSAFKANLGKLAKFDEGFQPQQKKSGGLFGMLGSLASIGAMFIPGGQALSAGMMALKAGLTAAPMLGGGLDALTGLASGGDVTPGQSYIVGEKQPELFVPNAAGRIYPSVNMDRKGGGGETHFNFAPVVHATDSEGVDRMLVEHGRVFAKHFQQWARRENA